MRFSFTSIVRIRLFTLAFLSSVAHGAEPAVNAVAVHPLVTALETLYQRRLPQACDELMKIASMSPGLTDDDFIRLQFVAALRGLDEKNELAARRAVSQALQIDRSVEPPPFATPQLLRMLKEARLQLSSRHSSRDKASRLAEASKAASAREPAPRTLLRAVDALYTAQEFDGAGVILDLARSATPLTASDRAHFALRQGILKMESFEDARTAFRDALEADRGVRLPGYVSPQVLRTFEEVKLTVPAVTASPERQPSRSTPPAATLTAALPTRTPPGNASRQWGLVVGGTGLACVGGGAVAGAIALSAHREEQSASEAGDFTAFSRSRDTLRTAVNVADGLYVAGAVALGVGAFLFLTAPGEVAVGAGAGPGQASLVVGGSF